MVQSLCAMLILLCLFGVVEASSTGYDMILTIVIIEVIFSFLIGVVCILLSFNLFRALKDSPDAYTGLPVGEFPLSKAASHNMLFEDDLGRGSTPRSPNEREGKNSCRSRFRNTRFNT